MSTQKSADIFTDPAQFRRYVLPSLLVGGVNAIQNGLNGPRGRKGLAALRGGVVGGLGGLGIVGGREAARSAFSDPLAAYGAGRFTGPIGGMLAFNAADRLIPQVQPLEEDAVQTKTKKKPEPSDKKDQDMDAKTHKKADALSAMAGGIGGGVAGALPGAGAGGLYGLLSGAYQAEKGKKLQGALRGAGRGIVGGGLIGGGIGAGAGAGAGLMLPNGAAQALVNPILAPVAAGKMMLDPVGTAARSALGFVGGAGVGGYLGNKARKSMLGEPKKDEEKSEEKSEKKDNKSEEREERKAAGVKQADLYGAYLGGSNLGALGALGGAGLGGLYGLASGAYQAEKGKKLQGALRGAGRGAVGGGLLGGGTGLGMGAAMGSQIPFSDMINAAKMEASPERDAARQALSDRLRKIDPNTFAGLTTAGTLGGAALGGYLGDKALNSKKDEDKEKKEAELKLSPLAGMNKPPKDKTKTLTDALEKARKAREEKEKTMPQQNKAANNGWRPFDYSNVGPGGLISERTLPKSDGTGGAKSWKPAVNAPPSSHPSFQQPSSGSRLVPVPQPQQPKLVPVAAGAQKAASVLLAALKEAASTPAYRKGHKAQNRARYSALLKADGYPRARSFKGANPALLDAHHYKDVKERWESEKEEMKWDASEGGSRRTSESIARANSKEAAYEFGRMVKRADFMSGLQSVGDYAKGVWNSPGVQGFINDPTTQAGLTYGGIGAGLGGLYGLINPGEYEDEVGNVRRRGRLSGALRGALGGGALGGLAGAGAQDGRFQYLKHLANRANAASGVPAAPGMGLPTDRAGWQAYSEQFAPEYLKTSPLQSAHNAYSAVGDAVKGFMPKQMGKAPTTGADTPAKAPEVKKTDEQT